MSGTTPSGHEAAVESDIQGTREVVIAFAALMYEERDPAAAFERYVSENYIQHNPALPDGRDPAVGFLTPLYTAAGSTFEVQRLIVDGEIAALHVRAHPAGRPVLAVIDLYRVVDGLIVEHWDVIQPVPEQSANDHPMF